MSRYMVRASIPVSDLDRAERFYEDQLGLVTVEATPESRVYESGAGTSLHVYQSPTGAGRAGGTQATWYVSDLEQLIDELRARGVTFERYDDPGLGANEKGIHGLNGGRVAWFKDPDGNTFALEE